MMPLEHRIVSNIVEQSQQRVEGANFDMRKHLLEYDDVLNKQRMQIYAQRDRIFVKDDLTADVNTLLEDEIRQRVPVAFADEEGPWRLLAWLEQSQQTFPHRNGFYPSFMYDLLLQELDPVKTREALTQAVLDIAARAIDAEQDRLRRVVAHLFDQTTDAVDNQLQERLDVLHTALEGLTYEGEDRPRHPRQALEQISRLVGAPLTLGNADRHTLLEDPLALEDVLAEQVEQALTTIALRRLLLTLQNRLRTDLGIDLETLQAADWEEALQRLSQAVDDLLAARRQSLMGEKGEIPITLNRVLPTLPETPNDDDKLRLLAALTQGERIDFIKHQQVRRTYQRFSYLYYAGGLLAKQPPQEAEADILEHLQGAQRAQQYNFGEAIFTERAQNASTVLEIDPGLAEVLPSERLQLSPRDLTEPERETVYDWMGKRMQTEWYRRVLLEAITNAWVEYLTRIEALRVSIGLEAYAQRNPLVEYKRKASEMFAELIAEIRAAVISRVYTAQPVMRAQTTGAQAERKPASTRSGGKKKKKRKRRK
jgi:preprotein translocase subunit SecA